MAQAAQTTLSRGDGCRRGPAAGSAAASSGHHGQYGEVSLDLRFCKPFSERIGVVSNQNQAGTKLCGRFVLIDKLGAGGYGEVWRARDELRDTEVALKILYSQFQNSEPAWQVFQREFTLTARLNHPGVLRVFEPLRAPDATVLPMTLAVGGDLRQMRGAPYTKILPMLIDIAAALEFAHSRRIVHRDLK